MIAGCTAPHNVHDVPPPVKRLPLTCSAALFILVTQSHAESVREKSLHLLIESAKPHEKQAVAETPVESRAKPPRLKPLPPEEREVVKLPEVKVEAKRITALDASLALIDRQQRREEKASVPSALDTFLNSWSIPFFGGASAEGRAARARERVAIMDSERLLVISLELAKTPEERRRILDDIQMLKDFRK
jgi:hypothetical protein